MSSTSVIKRNIARLWNKQFLIFLFFLALSTVFWAFQALSETYEEEYQVGLELQNVPSNVVITTELPRTLRITLRDKGTEGVDALRERLAQAGFLAGVKAEGLDDCLILAATEQRTEQEIVEFAKIACS